MSKNIKHEFKNLSLLDLKILSNLRDGIGMREISSLGKLSPEDVVVSVRRSIKNLTFVAKYISHNGEQKRVLHISKSDEQSLYDSAKILYRLKIIRTAMGFSMSRFAKKIGVTRQTYSLLENGEIKLSAKYIDKIINFFENSFKEYIDYRILEYKAVNYWSLGSEEYKDFRDVLSYFEYYEFASDNEKELLRNKAKLDDPEINTQIVLCLRLFAYIPKLVETEIEIKEKIMKNNLSEKEKINLSKSFNVIRNQKSYVTDIRNFVLGNLKRKDFKVDKPYLVELLFLPGVILNKKIINSVMENIKNNIF